MEASLSCWQCPKIKAVKLLSSCLFFLALFKPKPLVALLFINKFSVTLQAHDPELSLK